MANSRRTWSKDRAARVDRAEVPLPTLPPGPDLVDQYISEVLSAQAPAHAGRRTVPVLRPDHGRWWRVELTVVGHDVALRIERPRGDQGLIHQCLVSQGDRRWFHQAGSALATARAVDASLYSVRFADDFEGPSIGAASTGAFHVAWSALYGGDTWTLLNNTTIRTVYRGVLTYH